jgi:hypothetical protein
MQKYLLPVVALAGLAAVATQANAAPLSVPVLRGPAFEQANPMVQHVWWDRWHRWHGYGPGYYGWHRYYWGHPHYWHRW